MDKKQGDLDRLRGFAVVRAAVAGYLVYLGGSLIWDLRKGSSTLPPAAAWGLGLVFIAAGLAFALYTWRRWKKDSADAEEPEEDAK